MANIDGSENYESLEPQQVKNYGTSEYNIPLKHGDMWTCIALGRVRPQVAHAT